MNLTRQWQRIARQTKAGEWEPVEGLTQLSFNDIIKARNMGFAITVQQRDEGVTWLLAALDPTPPQRAPLTMKQAGQVHVRVRSAISGP